MKSLNTYVQENLKFKINRNKDAYAYHPKSYDELRQIIEDRYKELGPGTAQESIDFNDIDVSGMTTFYSGGADGTGVFEYTNFEYIDVSAWDVSNVKDMNSMFWSCEHLKSVGDLSNWDVSNVEYMNYMFYDCENLESIGDISNWNISKVENIGRMFNGCEQLESIGDLSNWDVSKVKSITFMFNCCEKLKSVGDLSNWNVSNIKHMADVFTGSGITNIPDWYK